MEKTLSKKIILDSILNLKIFLEIAWCKSSKTWESLTPQKKMCQFLKESSTVKPDQVKLMVSHLSIREMNMFGLLLRYSIMIKTMRSSLSRLWTQVRRNSSADCPCSFSMRIKTYSSKESTYANKSNKTHTRNIDSQSMLIQFQLIKFHQWVWRDNWEFCAKPLLTTKDKCQLVSKINTRILSQRPTKSISGRWKNVLS